MVNQTSSEPATDLALGHADVPFGAPRGYGSASDIDQVAARDEVGEDGTVEGCRAKHTLQQRQGQRGDDLNVLREHRPRWVQGLEPAAVDELVQPVRCRCRQPAQQAPEQLTHLSPGTLIGEGPVEKDTNTATKHSPLNALLPVAERGR